MSLDQAASPLDQIDPRVLATTCFVAIDAMDHLGLDVPAKLDVIQKLKVSRSYIYERQPLLEQQLARLDWNAPAEPTLARDVQEELLRFRVQTPVLRYRAEHPGAWSPGEHNTYNIELRRFVLQHAQGVGVGTTLTQAQFAEYVEIPLPTLKEWWAGAREAPAGPPDPRPPDPKPPHAPETVAPPSTPPASNPPPKNEQSDTAEFAALVLSLDMMGIIKLYNRWEGTLRAFIKHLWDEHNLRYNRKEVTEILHMAAERKLVRRPLPAFRARGSTFIPPRGMQSTGDGKELIVVVNGRRFKITWQPTMDVGSRLITGNAVRPNEDTQGVLTSFREGVDSLGVTPRFLLLDNKECNKSAALISELPDETTLMYSTLGRPQNKAVIEGMFGLFDEELGGVIAIIDTTSEAAIVASVADAVTRAWDAGRNGRRQKRDGMSPIERYRQQPTAEQWKEALERISAIKRRHDEENAGILARCNPEVLVALNDACARFGFDKDGDVLAFLGTFSITAVREATALYHARKEAGRLDPDAGLRYFGGIVRNCQYNIELLLFEKDLVDQLRRSGKLVLDHLEREAASFAKLDLGVRLTRIVDQALKIPVPAARVFWCQQLEAVCATVPIALRPALRQHLCARVRKQLNATVDLRQQLISLVVHALHPEIQIEPAPADAASPRA